jgi:hypothetical protein
VSTPRTDKIVQLIAENPSYDFDSLVQHAEDLETELNLAQSENLENCRLLGISGSREAKLLAEIVSLKNELARLNGQTRWQCTCGGTVCDGQMELEACRQDVKVLREALAGALLAASHPEAPCDHVWQSSILNGHAALQATAREIK